MSLRWMWGEWTASVADNAFSEKRVMLEAWQYLMTSASAAWLGLAPG